MSEERLQEIKDSIEFQYTLAKAKGYDNALLFTNEEEELVEEIERLNNIINEFEDRFKMIKKIVQDNILEELDDISYACMMSTIDSVCDGKPGFLAMLNDE